MSVHDTVIRLGAPGHKSVRVDGRDLSSAVRGLTIEDTASSLPRVTLDLKVHPIEVAGETTIRVPEATREALIALGWTPPTTGTAPIHHSPESLACTFHEVYERLAPSHGYETREASAVPWEDVPEPNKSLMVAVAAELLPMMERQLRAALADQTDAALAEVYRERARLVAFLAACYPGDAVISFSDPDEPGWAVITITTPAGQMSWHIAAEDLDLFPEGLAARVHPEDERAKWDGHDTPTKYERLVELTARTHIERRAAQAD